MSVGLVIAIKKINTFGEKRSFKIKHFTFHHYNKGNFIADRFRPFNNESIGLHVNHLKNTLKDKLIN